jgi:hypothetical protein
MKRKELIALLLRAKAIRITSGSPAYSSYLLKRPSDGITKKHILAYSLQVAIDTWYDLDPLDLPRWIASHKDDLWKQQTYDDMVTLAAIQYLKEAPTL